MWREPSLTRVCQKERLHECIGEVGMIETCLVVVRRKD
jgi:hypothetical protein